MISRLSTSSACGPPRRSQIVVRFTDGSEGVRDLSDIVARNGPMIEPLRDPAYFKRVFIEMGVPTWPNGFDLDPTNLYMQLRDAGALTRTAAE